ncbi:MAG: beta-ketoacyl-ACP synthase II [candidate division KSB1 bacterium]|nr:beta-ketoacyl-ACP synthase II [candidate division KSB1 bacterium]
MIDPEPHATKIAGEIKDFDPTKYIERKEVRRTDRFTQFAMAAADLAVSHSGIDFSKTDRERIGVIVSSGIGGMTTFENQFENFLKSGPRRVSPFFIPMLIPDISAGRISIRHDLKGINHCTVTACASASHAIGESFNAIRENRAVAMLTGGSEAPITRMGVAGFNAAKAISTRNDEPEKASRPFDANRDGFVMSEGGAVLLLEELEHAKARNAQIYAEICGAGFTGDAYHITAPSEDGNGAARAMKIAIQQAGLTVEDIDYVNAHGTSTPPNDRIETLAIKTVFGEHAYNLHVSSTKSMIGHMLGASGAAEAIATVLCIKNHMIHPTINYETPDPDCDLNYVPNKAIEKTVRAAISNSFGFGGHNASLVFKSFTE